MFFVWGQQVILLNCFVCLPFWHAFSCLQRCHFLLRLPCLPSYNKLYECGYEKFHGSFLLKIIFSEIFGEDVMQGSISNFTGLFGVIVKRWQVAFPDLPVLLTAHHFYVGLVYSLFLLHLSCSNLFSFSARLCPTKEVLLVIFEVQKALTAASTSNLMPLQGHLLSSSTELINFPILSFICIFTFTH